MRILMVEDDEAVATAMRLMLAGEGMNVYETDLGEEAIELVVKWYRYDLLLLDISLPDMSGLQVLRKWRAAGVTTPVLVVAAATDREIALAFEGGADGFIAKPFHRDALLSDIRRLAGAVAMLA